jgi:hypothetical protein
MYTHELRRVINCFLVRSEAVLDFTALNPVSATVDKAS